MTDLKNRRAASSATQVGPGPERSRPQRRRTISTFVERHILLVFAGPAVAFIGAMMVFPIGYTLVLSTLRWNGSRGVTPQFIGLDNYTRLLFEDDRFWGALWRTVVFTGGAVAAQTVIGVALAVFLHRQFVLRGIVRSFMLLPMIATPVAIALVWRLMFNPQLGIFNDILTNLGLPPSDWVSDRALAMPLIMLVDTWEWAPLIALITLAGLSALPTDPFEAAAIDGAGPWQRFWHITLPMVRPVLVIAIVFRLIEALKTFDIIFVLTQGGPGFSTETLNIYAYASAFQYQQMGYSAALLVVFFLLVLVISSGMLRLRRAREKGEIRA